MGTYELLKTAVREVIKPNGNQEITGQILQDSLISMINSLGKYAMFAGVATPKVDPGSIDQGVFFIASENGTYSNFAGIAVENEVAILTNVSGTWEKIETGLVSGESLIEVLKNYWPTLKFAGFIHPAEVKFSSIPEVGPESTFYDSERAIFIFKGIGFDPEYYVNSANVGELYNELPGTSAKEHTYFINGNNIYYYENKTLVKIGNEVTEAPDDGSTYGRKNKGWEKVSTATETNARFDAIEAKDIEQDGEISDIQAKDIEQDGKIADVERKNAEQDGKISSIEAKDVTQDSEIAAIKEKDVEQDAAIKKNADEINEYNISAIKGKQYAGLQEAINDLAGYIPEAKQKVGLKVTFVKEISGKAETWIFQGGSFVAVGSWNNQPLGGYMRKYIESYGFRLNEITGFYEHGTYKDVTEEEAVAICRKCLGVNGGTDFTSALLKTNIRFNIISSLQDYGSDVQYNIDRICQTSNIERFEMNKNGGSNISTAKYAFFYCEKLKIIGIISLRFATDNDVFLSAFRQCVSLESVKIRHLYGEVSFSDSPKLNIESVRYMIKESNNKSGTVITLHPTTYALAQADSEVQAALGEKPNVSLKSA